MLSSGGFAFKALAKLVNEHKSNRKLSVYVNKIIANRRILSLNV
ncbi:hypothetical protein K661_02308 [Piscirickettsia salmonis LF-89 = ATCC VR-1361]|nr:hypothetical protein K661_02308 [Piscirickettsia salmonis LF-89 = ATCC VR-1361]